MKSQRQMFRPRKMKVHSFIWRVFVMMLIVLLAADNSWAKNRMQISTMVSPDHLIIRDTIKKVYHLLDMDVEFVIFPGRRALYESSKGHVDGELSRIYEVGEEWKTLIRIPTPIFRFEATVFSKNKNLKVTTWEALKPLRIGIMSGMRFSEIGVAGFPDVTAVETPERLFRLLVTDRVDVVVFSRINGLCLINELGLGDKVFALSPALEKINAYHYVHEKHKKLVPMLDEAIQKIVASEKPEWKEEEFLKKHCQM